MSKRILIVDDELDLIDIFKGRLETNGYTVIVASDGVEGLEKAKTEKPDLILLDIMMPKMDGYQVCRFLKFDEAFKHIPIILLTARGQKQDQTKGMEVGADAFVTKPFDRAELLKKIEEYLK